MSQTKAQLISDLVQALAFTATASAPTNGMFLSAANELAISTNSTQRLTVDSSGNVGIGTTSPSVLLHVSSSGDTIARVTSADGNSAFLDLGDASDPDGGRIVYDSGSNLTFSTGSTERLRITNAGKVGIGTSSIDERLHVEGSNTNERIKIENTTANIAGLVMLNTSRRYDVQVNGSDLQVFDSTGSTERLRIDSSGNVGIGKSSPDALLDAESASDQTVLRLRNNGGNNTKLLFSNKSAGLAEIFYQGDFRFVDDENSDAERLRIDSSGNVGIGTASPQHRLSVERDIGIYRASSDPTLSFSVGGTIDSPTKTYNLLIDDSDSDKLQLRDGSTARVTMDGSGKVGIGTSSPTSKLDVDGDVRIATGSAFLSNSSGGTVQIQGGATFPGGNILLGGGSGNDDIRFRTTGASQTSTERMRIDSSGRLLVGLSSNVDGSSTQINFSATLNRGSNATAANANIGVLKFADLRSNSAYGEIRCQSDGTPGTDDYPGRLTFSTTADGASSVTERMRIDSSGNLGVGDNDPPVRFSVTGSGDTHLGISSLHARIVDSSSFGTNVGGKLAFVGKMNSSGTLAAFGAIHGGKEDNTNGANRGYLRFITRGNGGDPSEAMRIDSSGRVGIGTTSPSEMLHIAGVTNPAITLQDTTNNTDARIKTNNNGDLVFEADFNNEQGDTRIGFETDGSEKVRIDSSGNVGIGTTSPSSFGPTLQVAGTDPAFLLQDTATAVDFFGTNITSGLVTNWYDDAAAWRIGTANGITGGAYSEKLRIDSSGRLLLGTTTVPTGLVLGNSLTAASSTGAEVVAFRSDTSVAVGDKCGAFVIGNSDTDGTEDHFVGMWGKVASTNGSMDLHFAAGRSSYEGDTPDVTIKSGGKVGIGETSPLGKLHVKTGDSGASSVGASADEFVIEGSAHAGMTILSGTSDQGIINFGDSGDINIGGLTYNHSGNSLVFRANDAERARITSDGYLYVGTTTADGKAHVFSTNAPSSFAFRITNANTNNSVATQGLKIIYPSVAPNDTNNAIQFEVSNGVPFVVRNNGNVQNTNGSFTSFSDARFKENIVDASSQWDDIKNITIRNWNFRPELGWSSHRMIGPVAQELELVCPGLVIDNPVLDDDSNPTGEVEKSVNQSVLYMKAVKALQEAMDRIETLETKVAALEAE